MKLSKLIKKINKENAPPDGWKPEDKVQATSHKRQATSVKLDKYIADRIRWLMGIPPGEVDEDK